MTDSSYPRILRYLFLAMLGGLLVGGIQLAHFWERALAHEDRKNLPQATQPSGISQVTAVLYDGALHTGTPETQDFIYLPLPLTGNQAMQTFTDSLTELDTTAHVSDYAGYFAKSGLYLPLDRNNGYAIKFTAQVVTETHLSHDRAGFSLLVTSSDKRGIELGFWADEVWAQEGGVSQPFTHAEGASFTTTTGLVDYELAVFSDTYTLTADSAIVLYRPLRDYAAAPPPPLPLNPYNTPNLVFLGDDTAGAKAKIRLGYAAVDNNLPFSIYLPVILKD